LKRRIDCLQENAKEVLKQRLWISYLKKELKKRIECLQENAKKLSRQRGVFQFEKRIETTHRLPTMEGQKIVETTVRFPT